MIEMVYRQQIDFWRVHFAATMTNRFRVRLENFKNKVPARNHGTTPQPIVTPGQLTILGSEVKRHVKA